MFAQVIVDIVHENVAHVFTYRVPEGIHASQGMRVLVPFGPRKVEGLVLSLSPDTEYPMEKIKAILRPLEDYPAVLPALIDLGREMADSTHCPLAETLRLMLPAAMRGGRVKEKTEPAARLNIPKEDAEAAAFAQKRSPRRALLLTLLKDGESHPVKELALMVKDPMEALKKLESMGLVAISQEEVFRSPYEDMVTRAVADPPLMSAQQEVLHEMEPALAKGAGAYLLHGVTGSGKTEVYIRLVRKTLAMGRGAIILVPEIALTPQMVQWFRDRFGPVAAVLHSRLSQGERFDEWRRIRKGDARVVVGARSAVFAPVERLGLIVVDEEHEQSYLSEHHPRYDAREVAQSRCQREGGVLLLSSATPSILTFAKAMRGDYTLLEMPSRVMDRPLPEVFLVDMRKELEAGNRSIFSTLLLSKLRECMDHGNQAMLFLNRRGYQSFVSCRSCGYVVKCGQCDIAMTYHQTGGDGRMHCHYCGSIAPPPEECPQCGSKYIRYFGLGTQKVEEEVQKLLPGVPVLRMDIDTTGGKDAHYKMLSSFRAGDYRILIGTQMIAKGLDFPNVTLVGVVAADMTLNLPDYRSPERTFQLLTQVAGRAGRALDLGEVVVQTYKPENPVIQAAAAQDYRAFYQMEFQRRRTGLYPPFTVLCRLLVESEQGKEAQNVCQQLHEKCKAYLKEHPAIQKRVLLMHMDAAPVKLIRGKTRYHVLFKLFEHPDGHTFAGFLSDLAQAQSEPLCQVYYEWNPASMM
jgi:primosomal protein N' (replication factor Y)